MFVIRVLSLSIAIVIANEKAIEGRKQQRGMKRSKARGTAQKSALLIINKTSNVQFEAAAKFGTLSSKIENCINSFPFAIVLRFLVGFRNSFRRFG